MNLFPQCTEEESHGKLLEREGPSVSRRLAKNSSRTTRLFNCQTVIDAALSELQCAVNPKPNGIVATNTIKMIKFSTH